MSFINSRIIEGVNRLVRCANLKAVGSLSMGSCRLLNTPPMCPKNEVLGAFQLQGSAD
jgi:hypothetical protein